MHDQITTPRTLNADPEICYCCKTQASLWLEFKSEETHTRMKLCYHHFKGLRAKLMEYLQSCKTSS